MRSPEAAVVRRAPLHPLLAKELREIVSGRALWTMLLILCPLVGYSFWQAVVLYGEASAAARDAPVLASGLSPLDGVLVPTFGALYVAVTFLFPFVAIRSLGREKETGALRLLLQLPYQVPTLIAAKMAAIFGAWLVVLIPTASAVVIWAMLGGHLYVPETANLVLGHLLYGLLVGAIALFAASISESSATAAIIALAFTIGSWVLDFALAGQPGALEWLSRLSLTQTLRTFEQGLLSPGLLLGVMAATCGFAALSAVWLHPGVPLRTKVLRSIACVAAVAAVLALATQVRTSVDLTEDRRNSFPAADQRALAGLREPLLVTVRLAPEDPRYVDLRRNVLAKLERALPDVSIRLATTGQSVVGSSSDEAYGEIEYSYAGRADKSRSTSPREILPLLYALAGKPTPPPGTGEEYPGYPLVADGRWTLPWFLVGLPLLIVIAWWRSRRPPQNPCTTHQRGRSSMNKIKSTIGTAVACGALAALLIYANAAQPLKIDFSDETAGAEPKSFVSVVGVWRIEAEGNNKVLAVDGRQWKEGQTSAGIADKARALYGDRYAEFLDRVQAYAYFPYVVAKDVTDFRDGEISVRFEGISGRIDQGAGILFNLKPNGDYLTIRANPLENNLVLWKFEKGKRSSVTWIRNTPTATRQWHDLKVRIAGAKVAGYLDGKLYLEHVLPQPVSGRIGLWSKADSHVYFDDFTVTPAD